MLLSCFSSTVRTLVPGIALMFVALPVCMAGMACGLVCVLPFIIDQMSGASADDIGAAVQWTYWGAVVVNIMGSR